MASAAGSMVPERKIERMMQPLRRNHLSIWVVLPILLGVLFVAGLMARRTTMPVNSGVHWDKYK